MTTDPSGQMETMSQATTRLQAEGHVENWFADDGKLRCSTCSATYEPRSITVDEVVRFEGPSDPGDEAILFALSRPCGHRGQYLAAYGPNTSADVVEVITALARDRSSSLVAVRREPLIALADQRKRGARKLSTTDEAGL